MARKSTLGESTILRGPLGSHKLTEIFRVAFFSDRTMYYMVTAVELDNMQGACFQYHLLSYPILSLKVHR